MHQNFELEPTCAVLLHREENAGQEKNWRCQYESPDLSHLSFAILHFVGPVLAGVKQATQNTLEKVLCVPGGKRNLADDTSIPFENNEVNVSGSWWAYIACRAHTIVA